MAQKDVKTLISQIKKDGLQNLYYLFGTDISSLEKTTKYIINSAVGENEDYALNRLNGKNINISEFHDMLEMMPMMSDYNCIVVNDYNFEEHKEDENKQLLDALKEIPSQTVVIFNVTGFEIKMKSSSGKRIISDKNKKIADFIAQNGTVCEFVPKTPNELAKEVSAKVSSRGGMISILNAIELVNMCLSDTLMISNEIDKLCAYADGREITTDMIHELVSQQSDVTVYNLANAVSSFNKKAAFEALDDLMSKRVGRGAILGTISNSFLDMYRACCARAGGHSIADMQNDYGYKWEFIVKNAFRDSSRMSIKRLRECVGILRDTTVKLNSTSSDERVVLEEAVTKMLITKN